MTHARSAKELLIRHLTFLKGAIHSITRDSASFISIPSGWI
jgi:hypothetical protein